MESILKLPRKLQILDVGAASIAEKPRYQPLIEKDIAHLHAFEGDPRQIEKLQAMYGDRATVHTQFLFDGTEQTVHIATPQSGMTSLYEPDPSALAYFNGFEQFGEVQATRRVATQRLDDVSSCPGFDFVKMDIQGAELTVLKNGLSKIADAVALQLEVSFVPLYKGQPCFGDIDLWLRSQGFMPHSFIDVKRWSIAPTVFNNSVRNGLNQLLESDVVYIKDPLSVADWESIQLRALMNLGHFCLGSPDLVVRLARELVRRGESSDGEIDAYLHSLNALTGPSNQLSILR